jgi:glutathione S-transferase
MILIGQFDSPFVRRTAIVLNYHGLAYERRVLSVFADFENVLEENPLGKVPVLQLENGEKIFDSRMIIDYIEQLMPEAARLTPTTLKHRLQVQRLEAVALGLTEKSYERGIEYARRSADKVDAHWACRLKKQIVSALNWLESHQPNPWVYGDKLSQADITCAVAFTYLREKQQIKLCVGDYPALDKHCDHCESLLSFSSSPYSASEAHRSGWRPRDE